MKSEDGSRLGVPWGRRRQLSIEDLLLFAGFAPWLSGAIFGAPGLQCFCLPDPAQEYALASASHVLAALELFYIQAPTQ